MQKPLKARHRYDPFSPDLHSWRESTGSGEAVQGVGVQAQPLGCLPDRDEVGSQRSSEVVIGSPLFKDIVFHLGDGGTITENAPAAADNAPYVRSLTVNGTSWTRTYLPSSVFTKGGTLDWTLATSPSITWGAAAKDAPPSSTEGLLPALGYVSNSNGESLVDPGSSVNISLGVQSMSKGSLHISWSATSESGSGIAVEPAGGTLTVNSESKSAEPIHLHVPAATPAGTSTVTFALHTANGAALPDVVTQVEVP